MMWCPKTIFKNGMQATLIPNAKIYQTCSIAFEMRYTAVRRVCSGSLGIPTREEPGIPGQPAAKRTRKHKHIDNNNMKKTIIALLALAGVAAADYTGSFSWGAGEGAAFTFSDAESIALILEGGSSVTAGYKTADSYPNTFTPDVNVGGAGDNTDGTPWTLDFAIVNYSGSALTINAITFDAFAFNGQGAAQSGDFKTRDIVFALTGAAEVSVVHSFTNIDADPDVKNWDTNPTLTFDAPIVIGSEEGSSAHFTLKVSELNTASNGCFIGLTGATLVTPTAAVPEPTTATLSLLALAGLAARRRRR